MKTLKNFLLLAVILLANSCQTDTSKLSIEETDNDVLGISVVVANSKKTFKFKDRATFEKIVSELNTKTNDEKIKFAENMGVQTPLAMLTRADNELEEIGSASVDIKEFSEKYSIFKEKYREYFYFNETKDGDISPYSKYINSELECIINTDGNYMIGDTLTTVPIYKDISTLVNSQVKQDQSTRSFTSNELNYAKGEDYHRTCEIWLSKTGLDIYMRLVAKKKLWYGWVKYDTQYHAEFLLTSQPAGRFEFLEAKLLGYPEEKGYVNMDNKQFSIWTYELDGDFTIKFGRLVPVYYPVIQSLSGSMGVWSRGVSYENRGIGNVSL